MLGYDGSLGSYTHTSGNRNHERCGRLATDVGFTDAPAAASFSPGRRSTSTILILVLALLIVCLWMSIAVVCWCARKVIRFCAKLSVMLGKRKQSAA